MTPDLINGLFEGGGAAAVWLSIFRLRRDKRWAGISPWQIAFFQSWGLWNVYFYPAVHQPISFLAGIALASSNSIYLFFLYRYRGR